MKLISNLKTSMKEFNKVNDNAVYISLKKKAKTVRAFRTVCNIVYKGNPKTETSTDTEI